MAKDKKMTRAELPKGYEYKMVILLMLAFGFVMFDRFALANLAPYWLPDMGMTEADLGLSMSVFAFTWAIVGFFGSYIADSKVSRKLVLAIAVLVFSICSFLTGLIQGLVSLLLIRAVMGCAEGPVMPISQSFIISQSSPSRRGLNMGLLQVTSVGIFSTLLGPIVQVALANTIGWRATFFVTIIPGIIIAILILKVLINPRTEIAVGEEAIEELPKGSFWKAIKNRNVILSYVCGVFALVWYINMLTYAPMYFTSVAGLDPSSMSIVMSALGITAVIDGIFWNKLSDVIGRKPVLLMAGACGIIGTILIIVVVNAGMGTNLALLVVLGMFTWLGVGFNGLIQSTIPGEATDQRYAASVIGSNQLICELIGATLGASVLGFIATMTNLTVIMVIMVISFCVGWIFVWGLKETAPLVVEKRAAKKAA